jgi:hypothetical protein
MVPIDDLSLIADIQHPDVIVSVFTSTYKIKDVQDHLDKLAALFTSKKIFVGGLQFKLHNYIFPSNIILIESIDSLKYQLDLLN